MFKIAYLFTLVFGLLAAAGPVKDRRNNNQVTNKTPRVVSYFAYFHLMQNTGPYTPLLPLLTEKSGVTDVLLFVCDLHDNAPYLTVGGEPPDNSTFLGPLWNETAQLQAGGINVLASFGGYSPDMFLLLEYNFDFYYPILRDFLKQYKLSGVDFDIEPSTGTLTSYATGESIVKLLKAIRNDFGPDFLVTLAPVADDLTNVQAFYSGFNYQLLDAAAVDDNGDKIIDFFNAQFYSGYGYCNTTETYDQAVAAGFAPERIVMLVPADSNDADPFCDISTLEGVATKLARNYSTSFGGMGE